MHTSIADWIQTIFARRQEVAPYRCRREVPGRYVEYTVFFVGRHSKIECDTWRELFNFVAEVESDADRPAVT